MVNIETLSFIQVESKKRRSDYQHWSYHFRRRFVKHNSGHWIWRGRFQNKLPLFSTQGGNHSARKLAMILENKLPPPKEKHRQFFKNRCGNYKCINPDHNVVEYGIDVETVLTKWKAHMAAYTTLRILAKEQGVSHQAIEQLLHKHGLPTKRTKF